MDSVMVGMISSQRWAIILCIITGCLVVGMLALIKVLGGVYL